MKASLILLALVAVLLPYMAFGQERSEQCITITAYVDAFAEWADPSPILIEFDAGDPTGSAGQDCLLTKSVTLYTNTDTNITAVPALHGGILSSGTRSLPTAYRLSGPLTNPDSRFKAPAQFFAPGNIYRLSPNAVQEALRGAYPLTLSVQTARPSDSTEKDNGDRYSCSITLVATW